MRGEGQARAGWCWQSLWPVHTVESHILSEGAPETRVCKEGAVSVGRSISSLYGRVCKKGSTQPFVRLLPPLFIPQADAFST